MLQKFKENKLYANWANNEFASLKINFLGFWSREWVRPDLRKIKSIKEWQSLVLAKGARSFLGLANFNRKFINYFFTLTRSLTNLLKKEGLFEWKDEQQKAFDS